MDNKEYISMHTEQVITRWLEEYYQGDQPRLDIIHRWSDISIDKIQGQCTITSKAISAWSKIGKYVGAVTLPYIKRDLNQMFEYPFLFNDNYPTTFAVVRSYFNDNYGFLMEDGDFTITGNSITGPLSSTDRIDAEPDSETSTITLAAQPTSGRFKTGSTIRILLASPDIRLSMNSLLAADLYPSFDNLTDKF